MKKPVLKRETFLGKLTVWFAPRAFEHVERVLGGSGKIYADEQLDRFLCGGKLDKGVEVLNQIDKVPYRGHRFSISLVMDSCPKCKGTRVGSEYKPETGLHYAHCFGCGHSWDGYEPSEGKKEWLDSNHKKEPQYESDESGELHFGHPVGSKTVYKERKGVFELKGTMPVEGDYVAFVEENNKEHSSRQVGQITDGIAYTEDRFMYDLLGFKEGRFRVFKRKSHKGLLEAFVAHLGGIHQRIRIGNCFFVKRLDSGWQGSDEGYHKMNVECKPYALVALAVAEEWENEIRKQGLLV